MKFLILRSFQSPICFFLLSRKGVGGVLYLYAIPSAKIHFERWRQRRAHTVPDLNGNKFARGPHHIGDECILLGSAWAGEFIEQIREDFLRVFQVLFVVHVFIGVWFTWGYEIPQA